MKHNNKNNHRLKMENQFITRTCVSEHVSHCAVHAARHDSLQSCAACSTLQRVLSCFSRAARSRSISDTVLYPPSTIACPTLTEAGTRAAMSGLSRLRRADRSRLACSFFCLFCCLYGGFLGLPCGGAGGICGGGGGEGAAVTTSGGLYSDSESESAGGGGGGGEGGRRYGSNLGSFSKIERR